MSPTIGLLLRTPKAASSRRGCPDSKEGPSSTKEFATSTRTRVVSAIPTGTARPAAHGAAIAACTFTAIPSDGRAATLACRP